MFLRCNEHGGNAQEPKPLSLDSISRKKSIYIRYSKIQCIWQQLVILGNLHEPINENWSHILRHILLHHLNKIWQGSPLRFRLNQGNTMKYNESYPRIQIGGAYLHQRRIGGIAADHRWQNLCPGRQGASPRLLAQSLGHRRASSFLLGIWVYTGIPEA